MARALIVLGLVGLLGCSAAVSTFYMKAPAIHRVEIGDTMEDVRRKLGDPQEVRPEALTSDQRTKVIWVYDVSAVSERSLVGTVQADPSQPVELRATHQVGNVEDSSYLIVFLDGQVSQIIERQ